MELPNNIIHTTYPLLTYAASMLTSPPNFWLEITISFCLKLFSLAEVQMLWNTFSTKIVVTDAHSTLFNKTSHTITNIKLNAINTNNKVSAEWFSHSINLLYRSFLLMFLQQILYIKFSYKRTKSNCSAVIHSMQSMCTLAYWYIL